MPEYNTVESGVFNIYPNNYATWVTTEWSLCNTNCKQNRNVVCKNIFGNIVNEIYCKDKSKPLSEDNCEGDNCFYTWFTENWGECNISCVQSSSLINIKIGFSHTMDKK